MSNADPTTAELRAAWGRVRLLRFKGWTFERALQTPLILWSLKHAATAARQQQHAPDQPRLI